MLPPRVQAIKYADASPLGSWRAAFKDDRQLVQTYTEKWEMS